MTDALNEQISAFIDGELSDRERGLLQRRLAGDDQLQGTWKYYHLIRDAMREDLPAFIHTGFEVDYVGKEPDADIVFGDSFMKRHAHMVGGLAIAASIAVVTVVGVLHNENQFGQFQAPQIVSQSPLPDIYRVVPRSGWESVRPTVVAHLNGYLVDHSFYAGFSSAQGILPYSRIAGYDH